MVITSTGLVASEWPECKGRYELVTDLEKNGFPVWKHVKNERYLVCNDKGNWSVSNF